ncbi:MAG: Gfo/Idh/MocA family oxidoreductase [Gemmatimonadales bacterium]
MTRPRVAIVGAGLMGRWHVDAAHNAGGEITAIIDPDLTRARRIAPTGVPVATGLEVLAHMSFDVVHVCTPLAIHAEMITAALDHGAHVVVEKPALPDEQSARRIMRHAEVAERMVVPVHQFTWQRGMRSIVARVDDIGPLHHVEFMTCSAGADHLSPSARDSIAADIVPHGFSIARSLTAESVGTLPWTLQRPVAGEWRLSAVTPAGCSLSIVVSMNARPTFAACRVLGANGSASADLFHGFAVFEPPLSSRGYKLRRPIVTGVRQLTHSIGALTARAVQRERAYPGLRALCRQSYDAFFRGGAPPFGVDEVIDVAAARDMAIRLLPGQ